MSDKYSEVSDIDFNSELESIETVSSLSLSPSRNQDSCVSNTSNFKYATSLNITRNLFQRELGFGCLKPIKHAFLKSYHLSNIFSGQVLLTHIFLGMTKCGRFLITYTMITDQDDDEWYATVYKYRLHWWNFKPGGQARKIAEVSLFGSHKIVAPLQMYVCQWPQDNEKILVYGLIKECSSIDVVGSSNNQHAFVTVTALPSLNNCQECRIVASSYMLDDIAASWDTCLRFSCLKHGYTVHTSFDVVVPYPEFSPKISLKCNNYAVFNANNFLYALKITLENNDKKVKNEQLEDISCLVSDSSSEVNKNSEENIPSSSINQKNFNLNSNNNTSNNNNDNALKLKEQIIKDFSEDINLNASCLQKKGFENLTKDPFNKEFEIKTCDSSYQIYNLFELNVQEEKAVHEFLTSPPLPTRVNPFRSKYIYSDLKEPIQKNSPSGECTILEVKNEHLEESTNCKKNFKLKEKGDKECFFYPKSTNYTKKNRSEQKNRNNNVYKTDDKNYSKKYYKSFFTRRKGQKSNLNFEMFIRSMSLSKSILKQPVTVCDNKIHLVLETSRHMSRKSNEIVDSPYEFVDDSQYEVEKLSQFRKKRLADKKYEFQDFDSENIIPFSIVRQESTLRSPRKYLDSENDLSEKLKLNVELRIGNESINPNMNELIIHSPGSKYPLELPTSASSLKSPLILEVLTNSGQHESVLRPFNRNINGSSLLSPVTKFLFSPTAHLQKSVSKSASKDLWKTKYFEELKLIINTLGTHKISQCLDTRLILENGILINDISEWYFKEEINYKEVDIYKNLLKNLNKFYGEAIRFKRRFVEVDDELVSVITDIEDDDMSTLTGYHTALNVEVHGAGYSQLQMISNSKAEKLSASCVVVDQQSLDIEGICHSVATTLCQVSDKTFTFCNDYDIEILDVCPRSGDVLVLLMMRIEGAEGIRDEVSKLEQYEASATLVWNLHHGDYKVCMVVPPQKVNWAWDSKDVWNPAKEASRRFRMQLPADVTFCDPAVRVCGNISTLKGISLARIEDLENGIQFVL